jgi:hypothetical protein
MHESRRAQLRSALAVLGAATLLVGGVQLVATAATGGPLVLGASNTASKTTTLKTTGNKAALKLKSKKGKPALAVSNKALIKNLNADLIDGKSLEQLAPTVYRHTVYTPGGMVSGSAQFVSTSTIPAGTYRASVSGLMATSTGEQVTCLMADYTQLVASGGTDATAIKLQAFAQESIPNLWDSRTVTIVAGHQYLLGCSGDNTVEVAQPAEFLLEAVGPDTAMPGTTPFVVKPSLKKDLEGLG